MQTAIQFVSENRNAQDTTAQLNEELFSPVDENGETLQLVTICLTRPVSFDATNAA